MKNLKAQNSQLQKQIETFMAQIQKQKELNAQHQSEIETLLTFNQRLLGIIENQLGNNKDTLSLKPISERSERESDLFAPGQSLIRSKRLAAKSEWGFPTTQSVISQVHISGKQMNKLDDQSQSESVSNFDSYIPKRPEQKLSMTGVLRKMSHGGNVQSEMHSNIKQLKQFKTQSTKFFEDKSKQIRKLSDKLTNYKPLDHLAKITSKSKISNSTADLIRDRVMKNNA